MQLRRRINSPIVKKTGKARKRTVAQLQRNRIAQLLTYKHVQDKVITTSFTWPSAVVYPAAATTFTLLNGCVQGSAENQRIGNLIDHRKIYLGLTVAPPAQDNICPVRTQIIYDKAPNGAAPTAALLYEDPTRPSVSDINHSNAWRFDTLFDDSCILDFELSRNIKVEIPLACRTTYGGNAGTVADIRSGSLYLVTVNEAAVAPICVLSLSLYYKDA